MFNCLRRHRVTKGLALLNAVIALTLSLICCLVAVYHVKFDLTFELVILLNVVACSLTIFGYVLLLAVPKLKDSYGDPDT